MITSNTENGLQKAVQFLNQYSADKKGCRQSAEPKQQQEFATIMKTLHQQPDG